MRIQITSVQVIFADNRVSTRYALLDDSGKIVSRSDAVRDTVMSDATKALILAETQAQVDTDLAALIVSEGPAPQPEVVTDAMLALGAVKALLAQAQKDLAEKQRALDALAETLPAPAETLPGGVEP